MSEYFARLLESKADLEQLLARGCDWLRDYLTTNPNVKESDKRLCEGINTQK